MQTRRSPAAASDGTRVRCDAGRQVREEVFSAHLCDSAPLGYKCDLSCPRRLGGSAARRPGGPASAAWRALSAQRAVARASNDASPMSVWLVALVICTSTSSPGSARPEKLTTLL